MSGDVRILGIIAVFVLGAGFAQAGDFMERLQRLKAHARLTDAEIAQVAGLIQENFPDQTFNTDIQQAARGDTAAWQRIAEHEVEWEKRNKALTDFITKMPATDVVRLADAYPQEMIHVIREAGGNMVPIANTLDALISAAAHPEVRAEAAENLGASESDPKMREVLFKHLNHPDVAVRENLIHVVHSPLVPAPFSDAEKKQLAALSPSGMSENFQSGLQWSRSKFGLDGDCSGMGKLD